MEMKDKFQKFNFQINFLFEILSIPSEKYHDWNEKNW